MLLYYCFIFNVIITRSTALKQTSRNEHAALKITVKKTFRIIG